MILTSFFKLKKSYQTTFFSGDWNQNEFFYLFAIIVCQRFFSSPLLVNYPFKQQVYITPKNFPSSISQQLHKKALCSPHLPVLAANMSVLVVVFQSYVSTPSITPDDDVFRHLSLTYSRNHPTMHLGQACKQGTPSFKNGITNGAAWYPLTGEYCLRLWVDLSKHSHAVLFSSREGGYKAYSLLCAWFRRAPKLQKTAAFLDGSVCITIAFYHSHNVI